jgi:hypothetical protein
MMASKTKDNIAPPQPEPRKPGAGLVSHPAPLTPGSPQPGLQPGPEGAIVPVWPKRNLEF